MSYIDLNDGTVAVPIPLALYVGGVEVIGADRVLRNVTADAGIITSGTFPIARGGTGLSALGSAGQVLRVNDAGDALEYGPGGATEVAWGDITDKPTTRDGYGLTDVYTRIETDAAIAAGGGGGGGIAAAFARIADAGGADQFVATGADALRIEAGEGVEVAFESATKKVILSAAGVDTSKGYEWSAIQAFPAGVVGGSDAGRLYVGGGSALSSLSGANFILHGVNNSLLPGTMFLYAGTGGGIRLHTVSSGSNRERMRIQPAGQVVIGTTVSGNADVDGLHVAGRSHFAGHLDLTGIPTSNPGGTGRVWNDGGTLKIT